MKILIMGIDGYLGWPLSLYLANKARKCLKDLSPWGQKYDCSYNKILIPNKKMPLLIRGREE